MDSHSVMTREEFEALSGHPMPEPKRPHSVVRLLACRPESGIQGVEVRCDPDKADRVAAWLARCADRNGWHGIVRTTR